MFTGQKVREPILAAQSGRGDFSWSSAGHSESGPQATPQPAVVVRACCCRHGCRRSRWRLPGFAGRFLSRACPGSPSCSALSCSVRFTIEQKAATDFSAPGVPGHFSLLAMGASDRTQVLVHGEWWRLFTATMLHGSAEHLTGNLITFLLVGFLLEPMIGIGWFAAIYFTGGFAGAVLVHPVQRRPTCCRWAHRARSWRHWRHCSRSASMPARRALNVMRRIVGGRAVSRPDPGGDQERCCGRYQRPSGRVPGGCGDRFRDADRLE